MKSLAVTSLVLTLSVGSVLGTPSAASAQKAKTIPASSAVKVGPGNGLQLVSVSVLGALRALTGTQLYYFPDPFDPVTGIFSPNKRVAIGPAVGTSVKSTWVAPTNSTTLGIFRPGKSLVFGLWLPNNTWLFSGGVNLQSAVGLHAMTNPIPSVFTANNPYPTAAGSTFSDYAWTSSNGGTKPVYTELFFTTTQSVVTPEPATLSLLGLGLAGLGGVGLRRRRKA